MEDVGDGGEAVDLVVEWAGLGEGFDMLVSVRGVALSSSSASALSSSLLDDWEGFTNSCFPHFGQDIFFPATEELARSVAPHGQRN